MALQMSLSLVLVLLAAAVTLLAPATAVGNDIDQRVDEAIDDGSQEGHPIYEFVYEVSQPRRTGGEGNGFGHKEARDGSRTWGTYFQQLSDGRLQTVRYWVDLSGYHAEVEYMGEASTWDGDGKAKRERLVPRNQRLHTKPSGEDGSDLVQALLDSFPKQSLQTKRSSDGAVAETRSSQVTVLAPGVSSTASPQPLRPIPVSVYTKRQGGTRRLPAGISSSTRPSLRRSTVRRSSGKRPNASRSRQ